MKEDRIWTETDRVEVIKAKNDEDLNELNTKASLIKAAFHLLNSSVDIECSTETMHGDTSIFILTVGLIEQLIWG